MFQLKSNQIVSQPPKSLGHLLSRQAELTPDRIYFEGEQGPVTYAQMAEQVDGLAGYLLAHLARSSERPILASAVKQGEHLIYLIWACLVAEIDLAFVPQISDLDQTRRLMDQVSAATLVTDMPELMTAPYSLPAASLLDEARSHSAPTGGMNTEGMPRSEGLGFLFQTSGTTGVPKWVAVRRELFVTAITCMEQVGNLEHDRDQVVFITPPLSYAYGLISLFEYTWVGSSVILPRASSPFGPVGELRDARIAGRVTAIEAVPFFYTQMARLLDRLELPNLSHIGLGGGGLEAPVIKQILATYPHVSCSVRYGLTETPSVVSHKLFLPPHAEEADTWRSAGKVLPIYELRLINEAGHIVEEPNQEGEIHIKGECLAWPYYGEEPNGAEFFATGDLAYRDANGELVIVARKSLYIKNKGFRFSPESVESLVATFPGVADCRVSMPDGKLQAEVVASDPALSLVDLMRFLRQKLPDHMVPESLDFVDSIPRTRSGKIRRTR